MILAIYSEKIHREEYLPAVDNRDYEISLRTTEYYLREDIRLQLDIIGGVWRFKKSPEYQIQRKGDAFEEKALKDGQILQVKTKNEENLAIIVWENVSSLDAYRKYIPHKSVISIGSNTANDVVYVYQNSVSHSHAAIQLEGKRAYVEDQKSRNGTYRNGERLQKREELAFGDQISIFGLSVIWLGGVLAIGASEGNLQIHLESLQDAEEKTNSSSVGVYSYDAPEVQVHVSPRFLPKLYMEKEVIDAVPQKKEGDRRPAWMNILPSMTMVLPMLLGYSLMGSNMKMGMVISGGSALVGVIWGIINYRYAKKELREAEHKRLKRYEEYLVQMADRIREKYESNRANLQRMYPDAAICSSYSADSLEIWGRKSNDSDFLFVRLGTGDVPFQVAIEAPRRGFSLEDDELSERPERIADNFRLLKDVPMGVSLREHSVVGILAADQEAASALSRVIAVQIAANHSYADVKIAAIYDGSAGTAKEWEYLKWLPHVWNDERNFRFLAANETDANDVLYELAQMLRQRAEENAGSYIQKGTPLPHLVLMVEKPEMVESRLISKYLFEQGTELGITTILIADSYEKLPGTCSFVVEHGEEFQGVYEIKEGGDEKKAVAFDRLPYEMAEQMSKRFCSFRVRDKEGNSDIPDSLTFFDMWGVQKLEDFHVLENWKKNKTYESMKAMVGFRAGGQQCFLDIHEKYHGPHGLVAGTTGSGKSETLQTYILSLAIRYSPLDVGLFIIDFKGGGMANLFKDLPHTLGQISNLSGNQVHRAMVSIKSENRRRQQLFSDYGVNHIDAYTKLFKSGKATVPMPHMLIIIDEFAELKREEPDFMRELISVAQVGRSLGVHLILATQKPAGTVDDNIWSNTKFKLCLRVADKQDSNDMLHRPDAAFLTRAGRCYMQVGNNEIFELFQSGWSGAVYDESGTDYRTSAIMLDLQGREVIPASVIESEKKRNAVRNSSQKEITQLDAVVNYLAHTAAESGFENTQLLWMPVLPERILLNDLEGYASQAFNHSAWSKHLGAFSLSAYLGMVDDPENQSQYPLKVDLVENGHLVVAGGVTSGKSTFMQTLAYSLISSYSPKECIIYGIDYSSQMLTALEDAPHVGGIAREGEDERVNKLLGMISGMLADRKKQLRGGNFRQYIQVNGPVLPAVVLMLDGYGNFREKTEDRFEDVLLELAGSGENNGIYLVISCAGFGSGELQSKIADKMRQSICLEMGDRFRYGEILGTMHFDVLPEENVKGRGLTVVDGRVLEYQTALALDASDDYSRSLAIRESCQMMRSSWMEEMAPPIPEIPEKPSWSHMERLEEYRRILREGRRLPVGWIQKDASLFSIHLASTFCYLVIGEEKSSKDSFLRNVACAACDMNGHVLFADSNAKKNEKAKRSENGIYASDAVGRLEIIKQLISLTNERGPRRKELQNSGMEDEEIFEVMRNETRPVFLLISDLPEFLEEVYENREGVGKLSPWIENIFAKGSLLNVYIIAGCNFSNINFMTDKDAWYSFIQDHKGIVFVGEMGRQSVISYSNLSYNEQQKKLKEGFAYASNEEDVQDVDLVVIPKNKGVPVS